jgi:flavin reductase (DIM6/NTAB) family NADH-FMN oxidoreductase RutF
VDTTTLAEIELEGFMWERVFTVAPLVLVGSREADGEIDLAPKHMAMPLGWGPWFGFVCTARHATYRNVEREGAFTVSWPRPGGFLFTSLAASPRCEDGTKQITRALPTIPARRIEGHFFRDSHLFAECELDRIVDGFGENSLVIGRTVGLYADPAVLRTLDRSDDELVHEHPLLAYLAPGRFAQVDHSQGFPLPEGFAR